MTLHKIDREKLAEAIKWAEIDSWVDYGIDGGEQIKNKLIIEWHKTLLQAAENWLTITDPGFEVSEVMQESGAEAYQEATTDEQKAFDKRHKNTSLFGEKAPITPSVWINKLFKAMIAAGVK